MQRRTFLGLGAAAGLVACGPKDARVTLVLGDQQRGQRLAADASKAFDGAPYKVDWANFATPTPLFEAASSGAVDTLVAIDNLVLLGAILGRPYKIVAAAASSSKGIGILVPAKSDIRSVAQLKGRKIIVSTAPGGTADAVLYAAIREAGLKDSDIKPGYMLQPDALAAFQNGQIEAWATNDPNLARAQAEGARLLRDGEGINNSVTFFAASDKALADPKKRLALRDAFGRIAKARAWTGANLDAYAAYYAAQTSMTPELARTTLARRGERPLSPITPQIIAAAQAVTNDYAARGIFPKRADVAAFFDPSVYV
ncbi:ABC transporter substrate-binding protein [Caulobacter soli]|uniref:ABC transporter substrate-binding protein n=1 Tax=Caulobacter soli TaxID=2708539 RepID=UPI0013EB9C52|nr:ABC transporter substrate-binding protein [Caulobacter soli]